MQVGPAGALRFADPLGALRLRLVLADLVEVAADIRGLGAAGRQDK
jgi:hypothetical protein